MLPLPPFDHFEGDDEEARDPEEENQKEEDYCRGSYSFQRRERYITFQSCPSMLDLRRSQIASTKNRRWLS
jgi:hypothetical protein